MKYCFIIFLLIPVIALSQSNEQLTTTDTLNRNSDTLINLPILKTEQGSFRLHVKVFLDTYFTYNSSQAKGQKDILYLYNYSRHHETNINIAILEFSAEYAEKYRMKFSPGFGSYFNANYATEPAWARNFFEANAGLRLAPKLWLDAGILPSPYGYEGAISMQQLTLTRSLSAENSPYYLSGAKLNFNPNDKWVLNAFVINGWQKIVTPVNTQSFATQVQYKPNSNVLVNWTTYFGNEKAQDTLANSYRMFHNFYVYALLSKRISLLALLDVGGQSIQNEPNHEKTVLWYTSNIILKVQLIDKLSTAMRLEYYTDPHRVIIAPPNGNSFTVAAASINLDYNPYPNCFWRVEARYFEGNNPIFPIRDSYTANEFSNNTLQLTTSLGVIF